jgi:hypothetical protein
MWCGNGAPPPSLDMDPRGRLTPCPSPVRSRTPCSVKAYYTLICMWLGWAGHTSYMWLQKAVMRPVHTIVAHDLWNFSGWTFQL